MIFTQLANVVNYTEQHTPAKVGMGATEIWLTDRQVYTVLSVSASGKTATMRRDKAIRVDANGRSESQSYRYEVDPAGQIVTIRLCSRGWKTAGPHGRKVLMGVRDEHYDYNF